MDPTKPTRGRPIDEALRCRRCEEILDGAALLFSELGYAGTDTQVLADRVGVGKGTLYRYFPSKKALFLASADRAMLRLHERIDVAVATRTDPLDQIAVAIEAFLGFFDENPELAEILIQERALFRDRAKPTYIEYRERSWERWQAFYQSLIDTGRLRNMPVKRIISVLSDLVYGTMFTNHMAGRQIPLREQSDSIVDIVFNGILTDKERHRDAQR